MTSPEMKAQIRDSMENGDLARRDRRAIVFAIEQPADVDVARLLSVPGAGLNP